MVIFHSFLYVYQRLQGYTEFFTMVSIPWRIHGAAIYGNMDPIHIPQMLAYIPAPWILWVWLYGLDENMLKHVKTIPVVGLWGLWLWIFMDLYGLD